LTYVDATQLYPAIIKWNNMGKEVGPQTRYQQYMPDVMSTKDGARLFAEWKLAAVLNFNYLK
jgi:hypothetical protein